MKRYVLEADKYIIEEVFEVSSSSEVMFEPNFNAMPGHTMPIIMRGKNEKNRIISSTWGMKLKNSEDRISEIAHSEVDKHDELNNLLKQSPCIIPASGFYKWKETVKDPLPFYLRVLTQEVAGFAGIYREAKTEEGASVHYFAVLTMPANALVEPLDDSMPVIIDPNDYDKWLGDEAKNMVEKGFSGNHLLPDMSVVRVPELVNDPSNNSKDLIQPIPKLRNYDGEDDD